MTSLASGKKPTRPIQLDVLRAVALFLVMGCHMGPDEQALPEPFRTWVASGLEKFGWMGVDLFFVLSGFLISGLLFREYQQYGKISYRNFFIRRAFKIYPSFYLYLGVMIYLQVNLNNWNPVTMPRALFREVFFVQNYASGLVFVHTWTLGLEEQFYLMLPLVLIAYCRARPGQSDPFTSLPRAVMIICLTLLTFRLIHYSFWPTYSLFGHHTPTHLRMDSLMFGVIISYYYTFYNEHFIRYVRLYTWFFLVVASQLLLPEVWWWEPFTYTYGYTFLYIGFGITLSVCLAWNPPNWLYPFLRLPAFIGVHSYSIYLWHLPIKAYGPHYAELWLHLKESPVGNLLIYVVGGLLVGIVLSILVEFPLLKLRDYLFPSRSRPLGLSSIPAPTELNPIEKLSAPVVSFTVKAYEAVRHNPIGNINQHLDRIIASFICIGFSGLFFYLWVRCSRIQTDYAALSEQAHLSRDSFLVSAVEDQIKALNVFLLIIGEGLLLTFGYFCVKVLSSLVLKKK